MRFQKPLFPPYMSINDHGDVAPMPIIDQLQIVTNIRRCKVEGHKWVDTSHAGPESGSMGAECVRCGHSFHTILY